MDEKKTKAVIYLKIVFLTMIYLGQRHPYMTVGVVGIIVVIRWMFNTLEDFGSERKKVQRKLRKKEAFEKYLKFLEQGLL